VVKSTPDDSGTDLFVIHQGLKVKVIDKVRDWVRVELEDGNDGWIKSENLQII
jgi:SH3-like domain-containing protein